MGVMQVLSAAEMQACDLLTSARYGVSPLKLMETAATAVADFARAQFPGARRITVLCGKGNNGGDGMMAARLLADAGLEVTVLLLGHADELKGEPAEAWRQLAATGRCRMKEIGSAQELNDCSDALRADLLLDAIVGTGFKPPLRGLALAALEWAKTAPGLFLSVDLPSGWGADETSSEVNGPVFPADAVITFTAPKPAHVFGQLTRRWDQPVVVAPIGSPAEAIVSSMGVTWAGASAKLVREPRPAASNKGKFGHVLVVGGSFGSAGGKAGAPSMSALAALRVGAGLVTAAVPAPALSVVSTIAPELMTWPLIATSEGEVAEENLGPRHVAELLEKKTVLAIGPGLGQSVGTRDFVAGLLRQASIPTVIDADALNLLAARPQLLEEITSLAKAGRPFVLTPHPGEMARLVDMKVEAVQANRLAMAKVFAQRHGVTLVLKGSRTLIAHPDGRVAVNTTGNPGMAKGGSGDLLTGFVAGMLAQYADDMPRAVEAAVYLHGLAADLTVRVQNEHTLLATDSLRHLSQAFRFEGSGENGYVWLQGLPAEFTRGSASCEAQ
jgi:NAD(P)H-hydrate epimerase